MINICFISTVIVIVFLIGILLGIIAARHHDKKNEIEGDSFRVDCSEKKKRELAVTDIK